jgi:uncharacterized membrane protein YdjX (TVP38/TMEM64 family)
LAVLLPLVSIGSLSLSFASIKVSETCKYEFFSHILKITSILLMLASLIPMTWVSLELITVNASFLSSALQSLQGLITSTVIASQGWMATYGQLGLFMSMILSSIVSPIPNEVILTFAGMTMTPLNIALFGGMGSTVGAVICFYIARLGRKPLAKKFIKEDNLASMDRWFHRWGSWAILLGRLVPFIPFDAVSYLSGLTKTKVGKFVFLTFLGSITRCLFYAYLGEMIATYNLPVLLVLFFVGALLFLFFKFRKGQN